MLGYSGKCPYCFEPLLIRRIEFRLIVLIIRTKLTAERDPRCPRMGRSRGPFLLDPPLYMSTSSANCSRLVRPPRHHLSSTRRSCRFPHNREKG